MSVGVVKTVIGQVFATSPDGSRHLLVEGDTILEGEQIDTGAEGAISITLSDGKTLDLGRDTHWDSHDATLSSGYRCGCCQSAGEYHRAGRAPVRYERL